MSVAFSLQSISHWPVTEIGIHLLQLEVEEMVEGNIFSIKFSLKFRTSFTVTFYLETPFLHQPVVFTEPVSCLVIIRVFGKHRSVVPLLVLHVSQALVN